MDILVLYLGYGFFRENLGIRKSVGHGIGVARGAAHALSLTFALLFLTVSRNLMTRLRESILVHYIPVDSAIDIHKYLAIVALILSGPLDWD